MCAALLLGMFGPAHAAAEEVASEESDDDFLTRAKAWVDGHPRQWVADLEHYGFYPRLITFAPGTSRSGTVAAMALQPIEVLRAE